MTTFNHISRFIPLFAGKTQKQTSIALLAEGINKASALLIQAGRADAFEQGAAACPTRGNGPKILSIIRDAHQWAAQYRAAEKGAGRLDKDGKAALPDTLPDWENMLTQALTPAPREKKEGLSPLDVARAEIARLQAIIEDAQAATNIKEARTILATA